MIQELNNILLGLKNGILELLPNIIISLVVIGIGYLVARLVKFLVIRLISYINRLVNRRSRPVDFKQAGAFIGMAFFWLIMFASVLLITDILGLTILNKWFENILQHIPNLLAAILIVFAAIIIGNFIYQGIVSLSERIGLAYGTTLGRIAQLVILFMAIIIAMDQIGIEITFLINIIDIVLAAVLFGAALAFGLGARTSISNILAVFYVRKTFKEGDEVQIGKIRGKIIKIDVTNVILANEKGQVIIPAKEFNETKSFLITKD